MPTLEWTIPFELITFYDTGSLPLNQPDAQGRIFRLNPKNCTARRGIRAATDPIPQGDGDIFHERYANGTEMVLAIQLWETANQIACDDVLCEMRDQLYGHLWSLLRPIDADGGRVIWTPSCGDRRMIDAALLLAVQDPQEGDEGAIEIAATIDTPFPYAISLFQQEINISGSGTITNAGNVPFWPVIKVNGPASAFTVGNSTAGLTIDWDGQFGGVSLGAGSYAEIDTFRGTIFRNGDQDDLTAGLDALLSDLFPLMPGDNTITTSGADADFLVNDAFA